ncbi:MAG: hypothetical protein KDB26_16475, partial [Microthrixaceae bacterium]|nr:hypothetical protein [Microthrixaceae bacterium]
MKRNRALGVSLAAAVLVLTGCTSTAVDGRAQDDNVSTSAAGTCPSGYVLTKIGKCAPVDEAQPTPTTTTSPSPTPNANPSPAAEPDVSACDGTQCDLANSDDEINRLVAESLDDVANMWKILKVYPSLHLFKGGAVDCPSPRRDDATAWTCVDTRTGGWNPDMIRARAAKYGATLSDAVRSIMAHEIAHVVLDGWGTSGDDVTTKELRADCLAAGYSRWTMTTDKSAMGHLPLENMKSVLHGSRRAAALDAGYNGTPTT